MNRSATRPLARALHPCQSPVLICAVLLFAGTHTAQAGINVWTSHGPGVGDNIYAFAIDPTTPRTFYAGTEGDGVFKRTDGGGTWQAVNKRLPSAQTVRVYALAFDPSTPSTLYAAIGVCGFLVCPGTVVKSTDGAGTWHPANTGPPMSGVSALAIR